VLKLVSPVTWHHEVKTSGAFQGDKRRLLLLILPVAQLYFAWSWYLSHLFRGGYRPHARNMLLPLRDPRTHTHANTHTHTHTRAHTCINKHSPQTLRHTCPRVSLKTLCYFLRYRMFLFFTQLTFSLSSSPTRLSFMPAEPMTAEPRLKIPARSTRSLHFPAAADRQQLQRWRPTK